MSRFHGFVGVLLASGLGGLAVGQTVIGQGGDAPGEQTQVQTATVVRCTNEPSDAAMINAVIAASQPGDAIVFDGPCQITETIKLLGNRSYRGQSRTGTVLWQGQGANLPAILASDSYLDDVPWTGSPISIRQMTLDGNDGPATTGIILRSWQSVVEDVQIRNMGAHGIMLSNASVNGTLMTESTSVNGQIVGNFITDSGGHGIFVNEPDGNSMTDWNLTDNWIADSGGSGIYLDNAAGWVIERNHVYGVPEHAIRAHRLWGTSIADNYLEGFGESSEAGAWYGINATIQGGKASTIANNRVFTSGGSGENNPGSTYRYIGLRVNYGHGVVSVTGNAIRGAGTERSIGLHYARGNGDLLTVASTGNVVTDVGKALSTDGGKVIVTPGH